MQLLFEIVDEIIFEMEYLAALAALRMYMLVAMLMLLRVLIIPCILVRLLVTHELTLLAQAIKITINRSAVDTLNLVLQVIIYLARSESLARMLLQVRHNALSRFSLVRILHIFCLVRILHFFCFLCILQLFTSFKK